MKKAFQSGDLGFHFNWDETRARPQLDANECFDIGRRAYLENAPNKLVRDWMRVAEKIADPNVDEDLYVDIVDHLGFTSSKVGTICFPLSIARPIRAVASNSQSEIVQRTSN